MAGPEYALVAAAVAAAAAGTAGYAAYQGSKASEYAADLDADIAEHNHNISRAETAAQETSYREKARRLLSEQRAQGSTRGLSLGGSAWDLYVESAIAVERDALEIRRQGELRARSISTQADQSRYAASQYQLGARLGAAASALDTASAATSAYQRTAAAGGGGAAIEVD